MYAHTQGEPIRMWRGLALKFKLLVQNMLNYATKHMTKKVGELQIASKSNFNKRVLKSECLKSKI